MSPEPCGSGRSSRQGPETSRLSPAATHRPKEPPPESTARCSRRPTTVSFARATHRSDAVLCCGTQHRWRPYVAAPAVDDLAARTDRPPASMPLSTSSRDPRATTGPSPQLAASAAAPLQSTRGPWGVVLANLCCQASSSFCRCPPVLGSEWPRLHASCVSVDSASPDPEPSHALSSSTPDRGHGRYDVAVDPRRP